MLFFFCHWATGSCILSDVISEPLCVLYFGEKNVLSFCVIDSLNILLKDDFVTLKIKL